MHLKRLELQGYKSFAPRTELEFNSGITAIVGPNGSGKSNLAEALRWVLGEQSYSLLRAKRTDDLIYAGGARRPRMGMAEVRLTLDNGGGELPVDYSEVTITRRAYRSGENEYYLNGAQVRLRDLAELLASAGLHRNGFTVIGQGRVDAVLSLGPQQRRGLLDEAAGIDLYQARRDEALARLDETLANLTRVNDIIAEIAPQLARLERRAQRAREHARLSAELEHLERLWYSYQWQQAQDRLAAAEAAHRERQAALEAQRSQLQDIGHRQAGLQAERRELRDRLDRWQEERDRLREREVGLARELAAIRERAGAIVTRKQELAGELADLQARRRTVEAELAQARADHDGAAAHQRDLERQLAEAEAALQVATAQAADLREAFRATEGQALKLAAAIAEMRAHHSQIAARLVQVTEEKAEAQRTVAQLQAQMEPLRAEVERLRGDGEAAEADLKDLEAGEGRLLAEAQAMGRRVSELEHELVRAQALLESLRTRQAELAQWEAARADRQAGARAVLTNPDLPGVIGAFADLIVMPPDLELAVEAALGDALQTIVVETTAQAQAAMAWLETTGSGRAAFLPLDRARPKGRPRRLPQGALGIASDLVAFDRRYASAVEALLGDVVIVTDLLAAYQVAEALDGCRAVTLAGQVVEPSGVVISGSGGVSRCDALPKCVAPAGREQWALSARIAEAEEAVAGLERALEDARERLIQTEQRLDEARQQGAAMQRARQQALDALAAHRQRLDRLAHQVEWHEGIAAQRGAERASLEQEAQALEAGLVGKLAAQQTLTDRMADLKARLEATAAEVAQRAAAELRTALAVAGGAVAGRRQQVAALEERTARLEADLQAKGERLAALEGEEADLGERTAALDQAMAEVSRQLDGLRNAWGPARERLKELEAGQRQLEEAERAGQDQLRKAEEAANQALLEVQRCRDRLMALQGQIEAGLGPTALKTDFPRQLPLTAEEGGQPVSLPAVAEVPSDLQGRVQDLRAQLRALGPVDAGAEAEYQEVLERHRFLTGQAEDLHQAVEDLRRLVVHLNQAMEERFRATFDTVARTFREYFTRLFDGGSAELVLTEPENLAETGLEILARPPGKRTQPLALLSGGERALTAIALLFALLKASPTPFCLLDEVDAMLDETNIGRFRQTLADLARETQFILITHNRGTIEIADTVYGVTMNDDGVSQVLSLRLSQS